MSERSIWDRESVSPEEWKAHAKACEERAEQLEQDKQRIYNEDGYAVYHNDAIRYCLREARLAHLEGVDYVYGLADLEGNLLDAKIVDGRYGKVWCVKQSDGSVQWVNVSVANSVEKEQKFYRSKGYQQVLVYYHFREGRDGFYPDKARGVVKFEVDVDVPLEVK